MHMMLGLGLTECRQEHTGQNGDDGDDDQQFDEGKSTAPLGCGRLLRNLHVFSERGAESIVTSSQHCKF
jgi:hypothetical protein